MLIREIPGYYFDEEKRKYFKVVNGSNLINKKYHNNRVQAEKRRTTKEHDNPPFNLINWRLGLTKFLEHDYNFQMLLSVKFRGQRELKKRNLKSWGIVNVPYHGPQIIVSSLYAVQLIGNGSYEFNNLMFWRHFERITNNIAPIHEPNVSCLVSDGRYLFYSITVTSIDFPNKVQNYVRIERLEVDNGISKQDFTLALYSYWKSLGRSSFQHHLGQILGLNAVSLEGGSYQYLDDNLFIDSVSITAALLEEKTLYLGCNNGSLLILSFEEESGGIIFTDSSMITSKSSTSITRIKAMRDVIVYAHGTRLTIMDANRKPIQNVQHGDLIKNFEVKVLPHLTLVYIVGITKIKVYRILENQERTVFPASYLNDNITIQPSFIKDDILMVKESDSSIRVTNLMNLNSSVLRVENDERTLQGIYNLGNEIVIHFSDDSVSYFKYYT